MMPIREKRYETGKYLEIEIYPISLQDRNKSRAKKKKESRREQKNLNDKNAKKHLRRLLNTNFTDDDLALHLTYSDDNLPKSEEDAIKDRNNFIRRVKNYRKKHGLSQMKYIAVLEYHLEDKKDKRTRTRIHHHIVVSGMDRDIVEKLWKKGRCNSARLQEDERGYEDLAKYLAKDPKGKKRWCQSRNLIIPEPKINDWKYGRKKLREIMNESDGRYFEKLYPGYIFTEKKSNVNDITAGIYVYIQMRKLE